MKKISKKLFDIAMILMGLFVLAVIGGTILGGSALIVAAIVKFLMELLK